MQRFILKSASIFFRKGATGSHHLLLSNKMTVTTLCIGRAKSTSSALSKTSLDFGANNHSAGGGLCLSMFSSEQKILDCVLWRPFYLQND